ncbi:MAG: proline--tRNA ligase, partial [Chloroflexi bacterium]|nr:proline--tRNA ligase [Chloroflexota bacterium]
GALIMVHGDDQGLIMPPRLAPFQVVIVPIGKTDAEKEKVMAVVNKIRAELIAADVRVKVDERDETPGFKYNDWEMRGVPLRIEVGPKDVEKGTVAMARRDMPGREGKSFVSQDGIAETAKTMLNTIHKALYDRALKMRDENTHDPKDYAEFKKVMEKGFAISYWCGEAECEAKIKEETKATTRCIPLDGQPTEAGTCIHCGKVAKEKALFAKAY